MAFLRHGRDGRVQDVVDHDQVIGTLTEGRVFVQLFGQRATIPAGDDPGTEPPVAVARHPSFAFAIAGAVVGTKLEVAAIVFFRPQGQLDRFDVSRSAFGRSRVVYHQ